MTILSDDPVLLRLADPVRTGTRPAVLPLRSADSLRRTLFLKRVLDFTLSLTLLGLSWPLLLACMAAVRITSRGPALYSQRRVGLFGQVFTIWKLRTMHHRCEFLTGPCWSVPGDPRVTWVGRILRATHIDELPQLVNVLRGQMSLVGPRPERPEIAARLGEQVEDYDDRYGVLPGITGHAQVFLPPDMTVSDVRDKVELDRQYIARLSVLFDVLTLARTARKVSGV